LNREPDLLKIHNFLPDLHRRRVITDYAVQNGLKSPMYTLFTNSEWEKNFMAQFNFRDSYIRGLYPEFNDEALSTTKLAELVIGLNFTNLDGFAIHTQYYLKYGHILPHHDVYPGSDSEIFGRRFATMIVYLESAKKGGKTIFPRLGLVANLAPGDAIYWYNVFANGESDPGLIHGGCPIWEGRKTLATFWLRGFWQEFRKQCPIKGERFTGFGE